MSCTAIFPSLVLAAAGLGPAGVTEKSSTDEQPSEASDTPATPEDAPTEDVPAESPVRVRTIVAPPPAPPSTTITRSAAAPTRAPVPIRWRLDLTMAVAATAVTDPAFPGLSEARSVLGPSPQVRFDWRIDPSGYVFVGGGVQYRGTRRDGMLHDGAFTTTLALDEALVFARLTLMPVEGLDLFADVGAGPSFARLSLESAASQQRGTQRQALAVFDVRSGVNLYLPKKWLPNKQAARVTPGVTASLGYTFRNTLTIEPTLEQEDDAISTSTQPLGDVALRGLSWSAGLFVRFM